MFQFPSLSLWRGSAKSKGQGIEIPSVEVHEIETSPDKRTRTLKHLIRANHVNHAILFHDLQYHNHTPHILGSAYLLGSDPTHLTDIYDAESKVLEPWQDSPGEVAKHDWQTRLGDKRYQRAFIDFFEDELVRLGYDWRELIAEYLFRGKNPLFSNVISGLGHPLIHMGYAYELSSQTIAIEALSMTAVCYNDLHKYIDDPSYTRPAADPTKSIIEILHRVQLDDRLNNYSPTLGGANHEPQLQSHESVLLEHWNSWDLTSATTQFAESQHAAVLLFVGTNPLAHPAYNFFLVHLLTSSHAVRILLPLIPEEFHLSLIRQWWLLVLITYTDRRRPVFKEENITHYDLAGRDWEWVKKQALESNHSMDEHYVKALRAMKVAAETWNNDDKGSWYLHAAVRFAAEFTTWTF